MCQGEKDFQHSVKTQLESDPTSREIHEHVTGEDGKAQMRNMG